jgi:hypothetical protein
MSDEFTDEFVEVYTGLSSGWMVALLGNDPPMIPEGVDETDPRVVDICERARSILAARRESESTGDVGTRIRDAVDTFSDRWTVSANDPDASARPHA